MRKLTHRRDTLEEIFLKAMGHLAHTPGKARSTRRRDERSRRSADGWTQDVGAELN